MVSAARLVVEQWGVSRTPALERVEGASANDEMEHRKKKTRRGKQLSALPHCSQAASASVIDNTQKLFSLLTVAAGPSKARNSSATLITN